MKLFLMRLMAAGSLSVLFSNKALRFYGCGLLLLAVFFSNVALALLGGFMIYYSARNEDQPIG